MRDSSRIRQIAFFSLAGLFCFFSSSAMGQNGGVEMPQAKETQPKAPAKIDIKPSARDDEIKGRLEAILTATGWFSNVQVQVKDGVAFLSGSAQTEEFKKWAGDLARNTQDVSAVVNKMEIQTGSIWDFRLAITALEDLWRGFIRILPALAFAGIILFVTWFITKGVIKLSRKILDTRLTSQLLLDVVARGIGFLFLLFGLYIIFKILGLTTIAFTIIGGTGILGLILGIAFKDITENLLASIFLSIHHPFQSGDLVEIDQIEGYVQRLTIRSTVLMTLEGNHFQIPNARVYKSNIRNFTVNPNRQESFTIAVGKDEEIPKVQEIALKVLADHPTVLKDPEPWVLVDSLARGAVILKIYFWIDGKAHSWLKVRSSVIRLIKRAFQHEGISLPGEMRELHFFEELSVQLKEPEKGQQAETPKTISGPSPIATSSEGGLTSEFQEIQEQARQSRTPEKGEENLLNHTPPTP